MDITRSAKRSFWRGLATLLPTLLTVIVLVVGLSALHTYVGKHVNVAIKYIVHWSTGIPSAEVDAWYERHWLGILGVIVAVVGLCVVAYFVGTFIGARLARFFEGWMTRMPILRRIYPGAKQVSEFFFSEKQVEFRRVVAIEYPRRGLWSIGFVTGRGLRAVAEHTEQELLTIFVPSSPAPVTGYVLAVPRREVVDLDITVDEAFQFLISGGVIVPKAERLESLEVAQLVAAKHLAGPDADRAADAREREGAGATDADQAPEPDAEADRTPEPDAEADRTPEPDAEADRTPEPDAPGGDDSDHEGDAVG